MDIKYGYPESMDIKYGYPEREKERIKAEL